MTTNKQSNDPQLAQAYNALRGKQAEPGPDYAKFGKEVAAILRDRLREDKTVTFHVLRDAARHFAIDLGNRDAAEQLEKDHP